MRFLLLLLLAFLAVATVARAEEEEEEVLLHVDDEGVDFTPQARKDFISKLPGLSRVQRGRRRMFSGYIPVEGEGRQLFYWLLESDLGFANAPVLLWTNGGPGCSGMLGLLTEQGPYQPNALGGLDTNPHAWTKLASMVFIEQPVGVGFSHTKRTVLRETYSDENAARDNYQFVVNFFKRFPELRTNEFYITSESYGGHYLPQLAQQLVHRGGVPNFRGLLVGNPLITGPLRDYGEFMTLHGHSILPQPMFDAFHAAGCKRKISQPACQVLIAQSRVLAAGLDAYALDFPKCPHGQLEKLALLSKLGVVERVEEDEDEDVEYSAAVSRRRQLDEDEKEVTGLFPPRAPRYKPCADTFTTRYLNRLDVRRALHVSSLKRWAPCNNIINVAYNRTDVEQSMIPAYEELMERKGIKVWIFSGDDDSVCPTASDQEWIWKYSVTSKWAPWKTKDGQVAGYQVKFKGLTYVTVHGAGHMVPSTRPPAALELLKRFLRA